MLLREKDKQTLMQIFSSVKIPIEVWAYGSRVDGTAHSGRDLDLVIIGRKKEIIPGEILNDLKEKIMESNIPILVELFDWARLPESFHNNIKEKYEVLFSNLNSMVNESLPDYSRKGNNQDGNAVQ